MSSPLAPSQYTDIDSGSDSRPNIQPAHLSGRRNQQTVLPPLPQAWSPLARSSSPRHHASASSPTTTSAHTSADRRTSQTTNLTAQAHSPLTPTRLRQQSPSYWPTLHRTSSNVNPPNQWAADTFTNDLSLDNPTTPFDLGGDDEQFLSAFADNQFSSPSTYPLFTPNLPTDAASLLNQATFQPQPAAPANPGFAAPLRRTSACTRMFAAPSRSTTQLSSSSVGESQNTLFTNDDGENPSQSSHSSFSDKMPPPQLQHLLNDSDPSAMKRRRTSGHAGYGPLAMPTMPDDDLFGESLTTQDSEGLDGEDLTTIDLTEANEVPEELKKPEIDNRTKISKFQCVICMDDATTLTVTHCGKFILSYPRIIQIICRSSSTVAKTQ